MSTFPTTTYIRYDASTPGRVFRLTTTSRMGLSKVPAPPPIPGARILKEGRLSRGKVGTAFHFLRHLRPEGGSDPWLLASIAFAGQRPPSALLEEALLQDDGVEAFEATPCGIVPAEVGLVLQPRPRWTHLAIEFKKAHVDAFWSALGIDNPTTSSSPLVHLIRRRYAPSAIRVGAGTLHLWIRL